MITFNEIGKYGRLGNQMFQIASTIGIAIKNNDVTEFQKWICSYTKKHMTPFFKFPIKESLIENFDGTTYQEPHFHYKDVSYKNDLNLHGYFQSEKYFIHCEEIIRNQFEPSDSTLDLINSKYKDVMTLNTCSIHIRRGDYINNTFHEVCDVNYYNNSIECIKSKMQIDKFLVFSDDINWCKANLPENYVFVEGNLDVIDLFVMSLCKHHIIANSSFSWWASWLNKDSRKIIIAPNRWFASKELDDKDIYTKNMIKL